MRGRLRGAMTTIEEIERLKEERNALVVAHYYVNPDVQDAADYVGDSFKLAKLVSEASEDVIVFCGVRFMGESAKILCPEKTVLLPEPRADCPMAHMAVESQVRDCRAEYGDDLAVVCYVNSTAEAKSWSDVCVTSSNAIRIVDSLPQKHILFIPDKNLGFYAAALLPDKHVITCSGFCPVHEAISADDVRGLRELFPRAKVLAHPECNEDVRMEADVLGSTSLIIDEIAKGSDREFVVATAMGVEHQVFLRSSGRERRVMFPGEHPPVCADMAAITIEKVRDALASMSGEVEIDPLLSERARLPLVRMMEMTA